MKNVKSISFPNNVEDEAKSFVEVGKNGVKEIRQITKNGEMASINWFQVIKNNTVVSEIKESICNVYGEDVLPNETNIPF